METQFDSKFNMAFRKLERIDLLLRRAKDARMSDEHASWKVALDGVYSEIWGYINNKDERTKVDTVKKACQTKLLIYLGWLSQNGMPQAVRAHEQQSKQLEIEEKLDEYERELINHLKLLKMDMPGERDLRKITQEGSY